MYSSIFGKACDFHITALTRDYREPEYKIQTRSVPRARGFGVRKRRDPFDYIRF